MIAEDNVGSSRERAPRSTAGPQVRHWACSQSDAVEIFHGNLALCVTLFITWVSPQLQGDFHAKGHVRYVRGRTDRCDLRHTRF